MFLHTRGDGLEEEEEEEQEGEKEIEKNKMNNVAIVNRDSKHNNHLEVAISRTKTLHSHLPRVIAKREVGRMTIGRREVPIELEEEVREAEEVVVVEEEEAHTTMKEERREEEEEEVATRHDRVIIDIIEMKEMRSTKVYHRQRQLQQYRHLLDLPLV